MYLWIQAFHIISVIVYMAGLLMYPRLKIYQMADQPGGNLFEEMRLASGRMRKIILTPSLFGVWGFGLWMVFLNPSLVSGSAWFPVKFLLVLVITGAHGFFVAQGKKIDQGTATITERQLRILNEVPAILLIFIVILAVVKPF